MNNNDTSNLFANATPVAGGFVLSPEDAARVRAMAVQNSDDEKMKKLEADAEYRRMVKPEVNDHICLQIFKDKTTKANKEYNEVVGKFYSYTTKMTDVIGGDKMHYNVLFTTKEDLDSFKDSIGCGEMPLIDLELNRKHLIDNTKELNYYIDRADYINGLMGTSDAGKEIEKVNMINDFNNAIDPEASMDDFKKIAEEYLEYTKEASTDLEKIISNIYASPMKLSFMIEDTKKSLKNRIDNLPEDMLNYNFFKKKLEAMLYTYENPFDLKFLKDKYSVYTSTNKKTIANNNKMLCKVANTAELLDTYAIKEMNKILGDNGGTKCYLTLLSKSSIENDVVSPYIFLCYLLKQLESTKERNRYSASIVSLLLYYDNIGLYDLETPIEDYVKEIEKEFYIK